MRRIVVKNLVKILVVVFLFCSNSYADSIIDKKQCINQGENFIFAGGECIEYYEASADREDILTIVVHGIWKEGTNTLGRYSIFTIKSKITKNYGFNTTIVKVKNGVHLDLDMSDTSVEAIAKLLEEK